MSDYRLTTAEYNLMEIIWERQPVASGELVRECAAAFDWKKSTTYTNLKKLVDKKMVSNYDAVIEVLVSKPEYEDCQKKEAIKHYFSDSLPQFLLAFIRERKLDRKEIKELEAIIDEYKEGLDE